MAAKKRTQTARRLTLVEINEGVALADEPTHARPRTRGDCISGPRPCPWHGCRYHLGIDVTHAGSIQSPIERDGRYSCTLDAAAMGGLTLEEVGEVMGITKERVRQIETRALQNLRRALEKELI